MAISNPAHHPIVVVSCNATDGCAPRRIDALSGRHMKTNEVAEANDLLNLFAANGVQHTFQRWEVCMNVGDDSVAHGFVPLATHASVGVRENGALIQMEMVA
jgi:hypothetical protein